MTNKNGTRLNREGFRPAECVAQLVDALKPVLRSHGECLDCRFNDMLRHRNLDLAAEVAQRVGNHPRHSLWRRRADQQVVKNCTQAIDIGPWALLHGAVIDVLLDRRIARLEYCGQRLGHAANHQPRGAKVQQHRRAVLAHQDVVGRHVTVNDVLRVQQRQRIEHRLEDAANAGFVQIGGCLAHFAQRLAGVVAHGHVGGAVLLPDAVHLDHCGVRKARQHLRFPQEILQP